MTKYEYLRGKLLTDEINKHLSIVIGRASTLLESRLLKLQKDEIWNIIDNATKVMEYNELQRAALKEYELKSEAKRKPK